MNTTTPDVATHPGRASGKLAAWLRGVRKDYLLGRTVVAALRGVDADFPGGSFTVIRGPSGSGKSTLLNLLGCLDSPGGGTVSIAGQDVGRMNDAQRTEFRARHIGFVFQNFNLLPVLTVQENVEYPLQLTLADAGERKRRVEAALAAVGLAAMGARRPTELSGGQRQRVAVARALVKQPAIVLADEPTANLDQRTGAELIALMRRMQRDSGTTFILSSHDPQLIGDADRQVWIEDGRVVHTCAGGSGAAAAVTGERP
jgi:putative ABC transport system ATP-binding protein